MRSKRNKTIFVTKTDYKKYPLFKFKTANETEDSQSFDKIYFDDALDALPRILTCSVDLILTDPPYTIRKNFGRGTISKSDRQYQKWCEQWIIQCARILKTTGSIYICINWEASSVVQSILKKYFIIRNRITWKREKGRGAKKNWKNNMEDIWFATKSNAYTFNVNAVKIKKAVIAPYVDKNGKPKDWKKIDGRKIRYTHPSNIWTDLTVPFWSMPENTEHPTQKPEKLFERIILASSNKGDVVLDPFLGSGTTAVVAKKLGRKFIGFEIEKKYYILAKKRLSLLGYRGE
ncbi:site-specific DNA-methyltransferase [Candidatus Falkowbacteria bacterium]|nr:site-specific DNA-methyltransferase [Candidatus Falkowbacteria bacterium]